jgi:hypothetical protein
MNSSRGLVWVVFQILWLGALVSYPVYGETLSKEQEQNLQDAKQEFLDPSKRSENIKKDAKAAKSDELVKQVGGEFSEDIYKLAGDVMDTLASEAQGDPDKMEKILQKAEKDPESFANSFSPEQRKKLKELANKIEQSKNKSKPLP